MEYDDIYEIAVGALFHDIGKFGQRADIKLSSEVENMKSLILPQYHNTHLHSLYTYQFFKDFPDLFHSRRNNFKNSNDNLINFAIYHHNPATPVQKIIQKADHYSSGIQRQEIKSDSRRDFRSIRLSPIFQEIKIAKDYQSTDDFYYEFSPISPASVFPKKNSQSSSGIDNLYKNFISAINEIAKLAEKLTVSQLFNALISVLERFTWCIPADTREEKPVISLYDHNYVTSAIATSLYLFHKSKNTLDNESEIENDDIEKFVLICGNTGGIQNYIYGLKGTTHRNVTKILRARSFYVKLINKLIAQKIIDDLNLLSVNQIVNAGGRFIIIAPLTDDFNKKLKVIVKDIEEYLFKISNAELYLNIDYSLKLKGSDFRKENFANILYKISENLELAKHNKYFSILKSSSNEWASEKFIFSEIYTKFEKVKKESGSKYCEICGKLPAENLVDELYICNSCQTQIKIGKELVYNKVLAYSRDKLNFEKSVSLFDNSYYLYFFENFDNVKSYLGNFYLIEEIYNSDLHPVLRTVYLDNYVPVKKEGFSLVPLTADEIAEANLPYSSEEKNKKVGLKKLGIFKGDVDNLGLIFSFGFEKSGISISKFATLSRMLDLFFTLCLKNMQENSKDEYKNIYTVYSGGDDLFLFSDWDTMINFSKYFYDEFKRFTCYNPDITLSAGIVIVDEKYPLRRGAELADEFLEKSKIKGKDRLSIFDTTFKWEKFEILREFKNFLINKYDDDDSNINMSFLHRLLGYLEKAQDWFRLKETKSLIYLSHLYYDLGRNIARKKDGKIINEDELKEIKKFFEPNTDTFKEYIMYLTFPIYWAILKKRR